MAKAKVNKKMGPVGIELPECPVCLEIMSAPIFQCQSGHSLCNSCTQNLMPPICPICRQTMTQMRNWQLEDLISKATVPCPNKSLGCIFTMVNMEIEDHLKECIFREMACPWNSFMSMHNGADFRRCLWSGKIKDLLDHFKEKHPNNCYLNEDTDININNVSTTINQRYIYLMPQGKFLFIFTLKIDTCQQMAYWVVQHIGSKKAAQQYVYEIQVTSKQDEKRNVIYTDKCYNEVFDTNELFRLARCAVMPLKMLANFLKEGKLSFRFNVKKNQPYNRNKEPGNVFIKENKNAGEKGPGQRPKGPRQGPKGNYNNQRSKSPGPLNLQANQKGFRSGKNNKQ